LKIYFWKILNKISIPAKHSAHAAKSNATLATKLLPSA